MAKRTDLLTQIETDAKASALKLDLARAVAYLEMARAALDEAESLAIRNNLSSLSEALSEYENSLDAVCKDLYRRLGL